MKISVVIVHFNAQKLIEKAIFSLWNQQIDATWEFLIIDNSQNLDSTFLQEENIPYQITDLGYNSGFARGVNQGLKKATGDSIFLVNQDAFLSEKLIAAKLLSKLSSLPPKTMLGCQLKDDQNCFQQSIWTEDPGLLKEWRRSAINCKINPTWQKRFEEKKSALHHQNGFVHRINGAFLAFNHPGAIDEILFDEDFFLYGEDVEWALRLKKMGWKFYYTPDYVIHHIGSASSIDQTIKLKQIELMDWLVIRKRFGRMYFWVYIQFKALNTVLNSYLVHRKKETQLMKKTDDIRIDHKNLLNKYFKIILSLKKDKSYFDILNMYKND